jgi:hypothetical protein
MIIRRSVISGLAGFIALPALAQLFPKPAAPLAWSIRVPADQMAEVVEQLSGLPARMGTPVTATKTSSGIVLHGAYAKLTVQPV